MFQHFSIAERIIAAWIPKYSTCSGGSSSCLRPVPDMPVARFPALSHTELCPHTFFTMVLLSDYSQSFTRPLVRLCVEKVNVLTDCTFNSSCVFCFRHVIPNRDLFVFLGNAKTHFVRWLVELGALPRLLNAHFEVLPDLQDNFRSYTQKTKFVHKVFYFLGQEAIISKLTSLQNHFLNNQGSKWDLEK